MKNGSGPCSVADIISHKLEILAVCSFSAKMPRHRHLHTRNVLGELKRNLQKILLWLLLLFQSNILGSRADASWREKALDLMKQAPLIDGYVKHLAYIFQKHNGLGCITIVFCMDSIFKTFRKMICKYIYSCFSLYGNLRICFSARSTVATYCCYLCLCSYDSEWHS